MFENNKRVFAVIVTYANRFNLLKRVIISCLDEGVTRVIVVDNNSDLESKNNLRNYELELTGKLKVVYLLQNYGSAGGYKRGLECAFADQECEYIWLLDDDNKPRVGSLNHLSENWDNFSAEKDIKNDTALLAYRADREIYRESVLIGNPSYMLGRCNSFLGFHIMDTPYKFMKLMKKKLSVKSVKRNAGIKFGKVSVAPYGGMFFHKQLLKQIGYPDELFFVYADDYYWSYRIKEIYLILESEIEDIDVSWNLKVKTASPFHYYLNEGSDFRVYYSVRNRVYFESRMPKCSLVYVINKCLFIWILSFYKNGHNLKRYAVFVRAVDDGLNGILGKNSMIDMKFT